MGNKKIIIVGAGASGLAAASRLVKLGIDCDDITILEAQSRIGGRIHTIIEDGHQVELGANWVHGQVENVVFEMGSAAGELNTDIHSMQSSGLLDDFSVVFKFRDSPSLSQEQVVQFALFLDAVKKDSARELPKWNSSLGAYYVKKLEEELGRGGLSLIDRTTAEALLDWYHLLENAIDASDDWMETCGPGHLHYVECDGDPLVTWKRGYSSVFDILMKDVPKGKNGLELPLSDRILLNKAVTKISWDRNPVEIQCQDGSAYRADYVLVTCSLGFLKANAHRLFSPSLPAQKTLAIEGLGFGTVDKIYLKFDKPWWGPDWGGVSFLRKRTGGGRQKPQWTDGILGFYTVRLQPNLLVVWITGSAARTMESIQSDQEVMLACSDLLESYGIRTDFPSYTRPIRLIRTAWHSNPFIRGSYSFRSIHSTRSNVWACDLAQPVADSAGHARLFFAGEATHDRFYSTVHGAIESGWREADRISKYATGNVLIHSKL